ncbi:MAG: Swt1 family HEPN domain-containing protein [Phycisphaerae bacterium]
MAITNHERVGKALELLNAGLKPFVERELKAALGEKWEEAAREGQREDRSGRKAPKLHWDTQTLLGVMWNHWNDVFNKTLGTAERSLVSELRDTRNKWAHQEAFSSDDAYRALDSIARLLTAVSAGEAEEIEKQKQELLRVRFEQQRRAEMRKTAVAGVEGKPASGLKPWREIVTPHPDVASGRYQQAEFAADLWQVYLKEGSDEYKHPTELFRRTFITEGLKQLLRNALLRLSGKGGDPVVELQTNFGGGKTHSMLALYHLFSGTPASDLPGIEAVLKDAGVSIPSGIKRAVFVGTKISPGQPHKKPDGTVVRTMWGEIAWQLGGKEGYRIVKQADETATNPGDLLRELFNRFSPCLILVDEWVAYARQLRDDGNLPAGTFDTQFTFAQAVSESAKGARNTLLVVSVPSSDNEIGGEWGQKALTRLKNAIGRVESSWRPASLDEGFEIVRRRLFQPITDPKAFVARDAVARAFAEMYGAQHQEFPTDCREADYERRIKAAYPIHPELFDRLYNDWSTLDKFQRTRGVLRLMAAVIHSLWERQDASLLILPANVPVDDSAVQFELTRYMDDPWVPVIEKEVDGAHSLPLALDRENPNLGRYSACRRVARTIYLGSAPTQRAANRGIEDRQVKLGCVQPGESVATFGDALRRLTDRARYLYVDGKQFWYSTQPTVARLADERAEQLSDDDVEDEIKKRVREEARSRGDFSKVHACAASSDIPDEREVRLVILGPEYPHVGKQMDSAACKEAAAILESRGSSPRNYKNTLIFLAADTTRLKELQQAVRHWLAWSSIVRDSSGEKPPLNLDNFQKSQAITRQKTADETVEARIPETYQWLIAPGQPDPKGGIEWTEIRLQGQDSLAARACKKLKNEELLMVQLGGTRLRHELDRVPLWRGDHVSVKQLAEDIAKYLYLPRLRDEDVLLAAIRDGLERLTWQTETFAYADGWDEQRKRYRRLQAGRSIRVLIDGQSVLVKPDVAIRQMEADKAEQAKGAGAAVGIGAGGQRDAGTGGVRPGAGTGGTDQGGGEAAGVEVAPALRRFHGAVRLDPVRLGRDASRIAEEVVQHLSGIVGANVEVTLEITAQLPDAASEKLVRDVTENCRTLKFETYGFEEA